jgi:hypothetical protein
MSFSQRHKRSAQKSTYSKHLVRADGTHGSIIIHIEANRRLWAWEAYGTNQLTGIWKMSYLVIYLANYENGSVADSK